MSTSWKVTHRVYWSAKADLFTFSVFLTVISLLFTCVPVGLVIEEWREVWRLGLSLRLLLGEVGPEALWGGLAWVGVALLSLPWAWGGRRLWGTTVEQFRDLFGADRFVEGTIERLETRGRGSRARFAIYVAGEGWLVPLLVYRSLRTGVPVRLRVTRFNHLVLDLAVPAVAAA